MSAGTHLFLPLIILAISYLIVCHSQAPSSSNLSTNRSQTITLLALRSSLGIRARYWPRHTNPCTSWIGIICHNGQVISINLSDLRRTFYGSMHPAFSLEPLQNLTFLQYLNSSGFPLPGSIPYWFGNLSNLQQLDLTSSSINSSIPSSLANLSNLQILILARNNLTGDIPSSLGNLINLTSLDLSFNNLTGSIPPTLANLQNLEMMNLSANQLTGQIPAGLGGFLKLQFLMLASNGLQGPVPSQLGNLSLLRSLDLGSNALSGNIPGELGRLKFLSTLILSNNSLNNTIPAELSNCTGLQVLSLDQNSFTGILPTSLGLLTSLSSLSLFSNNLTGVLPAGLSNFRQANEVLLSDNLFYGALPFMPADLPKISNLDLANNYFEGTLPVPFIAGAHLDENCFSKEANQRSLNACKLFYSERGLTFQGSIETPPPRGQEATNSGTGKSSRLGPLLGGIFGGLGFVLLIMMMMLLVLKRERNIESGQGDGFPVSGKGVGQPFSGSISVNLTSLGEKFSYARLRQATAEFNTSNLLKAGHSGDLYQGLLDGGLVIVVKRIDLGRSKDGYLSELEFFGKASHTRLVPLLGHCFEQEDEKLLVYKYMPNRDLGFALHRPTNESPSENTLQSLDWITRLKIAIGAAEGLTYLHHECTPPLVHRDVQASSILLDDKFEVRLGSLTQACIAVKESHHGVVSRLLRRSQTLEQGEAGGAVSTCTYDVYCFGKLLLELVSGKVGISGSSDPRMDAWLERAVSFINAYDREPINKIVDPSLIVDEDLMEEVWAVAIVAKSCLNPKPSKRPLMRYILKALENPLKVVREDTRNGSGRSGTSSHGSWNAALFGSWRQSSSENVIAPGSLKEEYLQKDNSKQPTNGGSQESGQGEVSSRRPGSSEIFPEPVDDPVLQAPTTTDSDRKES